jgi:hypothetical protein
VAFYKCKDHFNLDGFEKRRCETDGTWKPDVPACRETLCKPLVAPLNGTMELTTLRIGGTATFKCDHGFGLQGDDDIECLSSGSWSSWPPACAEIDCGRPDEIENGRIFLVNTSTVIGSEVEYHCFPGYDRSGPFERACLDDGYWSDREPSCARPRPPPPVITSILRDNTIDGTKNIRAGSISDGEEDSSSVGMWIGVALGLLVVVGLLVLGVYFYRKQRALQATKPPPYTRDRNSNGPPRPAPPPIQMYSMADDSAGSGGLPGRGGGAPGPIYDTINDDSGSYAKSNGSDGTDSGGALMAAAAVGSSTPNGTTFGMAVAPPLPPSNGYNLGNGGRINSGFTPPQQNDYDVPEGQETRRNRVSGTVTINGITV